MKNKQIVYISTSEEYAEEYTQKILCNNQGSYIENLEEIEAYVFTPEELRQLLEEYTNRIVDNVKMDVQPSEMEAWEIVPDEITRKHVDDEEAGCEDFSITVDKESIKNTFTEFLKQL
jgi:hypothetical protein